MLAAAAPDVLDAQRFWNRAAVPYAFYRTVDGWWLAGSLKAYNPIGFRERPEPHAASVTISGGASTEGSHVLELDAQAPRLWNDWRLALTVGLERGNRFGYYGQGNTSESVEDSVTAGRPYFYRVGRSSGGGRVTVQRALVGPVRLLAGLSLEHTDFRGLPGETVFEQDVLSGAIDDAAIPFTDFVLRGGVIVDTRDHEIDPHAGLFGEALYAHGDGYQRVTGSISVYLRPLERLTIALRGAGEEMSGEPPHAAQVTMGSSERPFVALGGHRTLRGFHDGRFTGQGKLLGSVEARYAIVWVPTIFELKIVAFVDAGRVFGPDEDFRVTTEGMHTNGGGELAMRLTRNTLGVLGAGFSDEGGQVFFSTAWSF